MHDCRPPVLHTIPPGRPNQPIQHIMQVGIVGLGLMGHGIGLVSAQAGYEVVAVEAKPEALDAGKKRIAGSLKKLLSKVRSRFVVDLVDDDVFCGLDGAVWRWIGAYAC